MRAFLERRDELRPGGAPRSWPAQLAGRLRPLVAGARAGLDDEAFLERLAAAKARGRMGESPRRRALDRSGPRGEEQPHVPAVRSPRRRRPPGRHQGGPSGPRAGFWRRFGALLLDG